MESFLVNKTLLESSLQELLSNVKPQGLLSDFEYVLVTRVICGIGLAIACCGVFTNIINIKTFIAIGVADGVTTLFLTISCTDLVYVLLACTRNIACFFYMNEKGTTAWHYVVDPRAIAFFSDNSGLIMYTMTVLASTFLAVARCMCVAKPLHFKNMFTRSRCIKILALLFMFPLGSQLAVFVNMGMVQRFDPSKNASRWAMWVSSDRERVKDLVRLMLSAILPLATQIIVILCVGVMVLKLREAAHFRSSMDDSENKGSDSYKLTGKDLQVVKQVVLICIIYIVLNFQKIVSHFLTTLDDRLDNGKLHQNMFETLSHMRTLFESLNSTVNFFVYFTYNPRFRSLCFSSKK